MNEYCPGTFLAEIFNVTPARIRQLAMDGVIPKPQRPKGYDLKASVQGYVGYLRQRAVQESDDLRAEQVRLRRAQTKRTETENDLMLNRLLEIDELDPTWGRIVSAAKKRLMSMPARVTALIEMAPDAAEKREILEHEISQVLTQLANAEIKPASGRAR